MYRCPPSLQKPIIVYNIDNIDMLNTSIPPDDAPSIPTNFAELGLNDTLIHVLTKNNITIPSAVQATSIPLALQGKNVFCSSETGSGKTLSFILPMLQKLTTKTIDQALVICPTREIAIQTQNVLQLFCDFNITSALVIGGTNMAEQKKALQKYPNVLVATPGRLLDMLNSGLIWLQYTEYVVLDEADRMLDMGFEEELLKIHQELTGPHQTLLFSATLFPEIKKMAKRYAADFIEVIVGSPRSIAGSVEHVMLDVSESDKIEALRELINENNGKMIVFFNTIKKTDQITERLKRMRVRGVDCLHSKRDQETRERLIGNFRGTQLNVLLASDVVARGLDIPDVELVVNFDVPSHSEDFIHRLGRTGRAGKSGRAMSFYTPLDKLKVAAIEKLINSTIPIFKYQGRGRTKR